MTPKVETVLLKPSEPLAASQSSAEAVLNSYAVSHKIPIIIVRLAEIVYGDKMNLENPMLKIIESETSKTGIYFHIIYTKSKHTI